MTWDTNAALQATKTLLASLSGIQKASIGAPKALTNQVEAYVTNGPDDVGDKATQLLRSEIGFWCAFGYAMGANDEAAELALGTAKDDLKSRFFDARKNGTGVFVEATTQVKSARLDLSLAGAPEYQPLAGQEIRVWPFMIYVTQYANP